MSDRYANFDRAIQEIKSQKLSIRNAAKKYGIPRTTLGDHISGKHTGKHGKQPIFNQDEEDAIAEHLIVVSEWGFPFSKFDLRVLAKNYLDSSGRVVKCFKNNFPGEEWVEGFLRRNSKLSTRISRNIPTKRAKVDPESVKIYFKNLEKTLDNVPASNILNYDETNLADEPGGKVAIFKKGTKYPERIMNSSKSATSLMFAGTATGHLLPVYVVYKADNLWDTWTQGGPPGTRYNRSKSGWFEETTFKDWFQTVVIPWARKVEGPKVVLGDNLSSHFSVDVLRMCRENDIKFVCLPPNSTHILQPLDVAFYRPLKMAWRSVLSNWRVSADRRLTSIPKHTFPVLLKQLMESINLNSAINLQSGFRACGVFPLDPQRVLNKIPSEETQSEDANSSTSSLVGEAVLTMLKDMRYGDKPGVNKRKRKLTVEPGKSVSEEIDTGTSTPTTSQDPIATVSENKENSSTSQLQTKRSEPVKSQKKRKCSRKSEDFSDSEIDDVYSLKDSSDEWIEEEETIEDMGMDDPKAGDWLLVKFPTKKTIKYYVGCVESLVKGEGLEVRFARNCGELKFKWPEVEDVSLIDYDQIERRLDTPQSSEKKGYFKFAIDFHGYCIN